MTGPADGGLPVTSSPLRGSRLTGSPATGPARTTAPVTPVLAPPLVISVEAFARSAGMHPELVTRLVQLGLLDATAGPEGGLWFSPAELARAGRIQRLREGLSLNYAALGVVLDLLDRIEVLETTLRHPRGPRGGRRH